MYILSTFYNHWTHRRAYLVIYKCVRVYVHARVRMCARAPTYKHTSAHACYPNKMIDLDNGRPKYLVHN